MVDERRLDDFAGRVLATGMAPALAVALTDRERTLVTRTYGAASPDALWAIGSIGKSVTAVLALQLADEGVLDLHAPVTDYVDWLAFPAPITLHHLLTHTSGLIADSDRAPASTWDVIALTGIAPGFAPGEHFHYSNVGYRAVGVVLEAVAGAPYEELVQRRVLDPLGMRASVPVMRHDTRRRLPGGHVPLYDDRPWEPAHGLVPAPWVESAEADGCLCCTPDDLAAYLRALWTGDRLLPEGSLTRMRTAHAPDYGYGVEVEPGGSAMAATCSATSRTCGPTRSPGSASSPSSTGSAARGCSPRARSRSPPARSRVYRRLRRHDRSSTTGPARRPGRGTAAGTARTTPGSRRSRSPRGSGPW